MGFGLFRKSESPKAGPAVNPEASPPRPAADMPHHDSAREILELLELELGAMIRSRPRRRSPTSAPAPTR
jgi:methyl-accepting chemotaxis protein